MVIPESVECVVHSFQMALDLTLACLGIMVMPTNTDSVEFQVTRAASTHAKTNCGCRQEAKTIGKRTQDATRATHGPSG
jgi:hypothetical protein